MVTVQAVSCLLPPFPLELGLLHICCPKELHNLETLSRACKSLGCPATCGTMSSRTSMLLSTMLSWQIDVVDRRCTTVTAVTVSKMRWHWWLVSCPSWHLAPGTCVPKTDSLMAELNRKPPVLWCTDGSVATYTDAHLCARYRVDTTSEASKPRPEDQHKSGRLAVAGSVPFGNAKERYTTSRRCRVRRGDEDAGQMCKNFRTVQVPAATYRAQINSKKKAMVQKSSEPQSWEEKRRKRLVMI